MKPDVRPLAKPPPSGSPEKSSAETLADRISGWLIYAMLVFSPWAFGTTQAWSIRSMNFAGYALGALLLAKWLARFRDTRSESSPLTTSRWFDRCLGGLTILILLYCGVAAGNARATYSYAEGTFTYHEFIGWLPHTYDSTRSWSLFWNYLALACSFWAVRNWLQNDTPRRDALRKSLTQSLNEPSSWRHDLRESPNPASVASLAGEDVEGLAERVPPGETSRSDSRTENPLFSRRWKRLLWVISINGALLALEGILQRVDNTSKLLWLVEPRINKDAASQFGPYAYRSNGAQLLNLIWPMAVGLWWALQRSVERSKRKHTTHHLLLPGAMLMAAGAIISLSRGGVVVAVAGVCASLLVIMMANRRGSLKAKFGIAVLGCATLGLAAYVNWNELMERFATAATDGMSGRFRLFDIAKRIFADYPVFGTGPNTFDPVSQFYRQSPDEYWAVQVHNDWLETLATFGSVGSSLIWLALLLVLIRPLFAFDGIRSRWAFVAFLWISLGGCLVFALVDFPFQVYSILFLFLVLCAVLSVITIRKSPS